MYRRQTPAVQSTRERSARPLSLREQRTLSVAEPVRPALLGALRGLSKEREEELHTLHRRLRADSAEARHLGVEAGELGQLLARHAEFCDQEERLTALLRRATEQRLLLGDLLRELAEEVLPPAGRSRDSGVRPVSAWVQGVAEGDEEG